MSGCALLILHRSHFYDIFNIKDRTPVFFRYLYNDLAVLEKSYCKFILRKLKAILLFQ